MSFRIRENLQKFFVIGISYKKTAIETREKFSLQPEDQTNILDQASGKGIESLVVLSTCNRTELYGFSSDPDAIIHLFLSNCNAKYEDFITHGYIQKGHDAILHLYRVASGLDSQIIGDFQIVGQVKNSYRESEQKGLINPFVNRLFSYVFQASKKVKNSTDISKGASSVSHAAVQYIKDNTEELDKANILLFGLGEIGKDTCVNLLKHMHNRSLTVVNRTLTKAENLANKFDLHFAPIEDLTSEIQKADVIVVSTGSSKATVLPKHFEGKKRKSLVLDLSVPRNVSIDIEDNPYVEVATVDILSQSISKAMKHRHNAVPQAVKIIEDSINDFYGWLEVKNLSPVIVALKENLEKIKEKEIEYHKPKLNDLELEKIEHISTNIVNKIARACISHLKDNHKKHSSPIETLEMIFRENEN
ncbi:glutamyl-tRNA reductase [Halosquirtibacter xylanolyticus]|uniref:glutamyl-tRNA reductase n=1 Tax=Halosquirtibacter xylanolyticus TaxID=3374599 RepID=UPI003748520E|nr:glutamyl-tRNA reductase [Prolixibacteraceae bacterium]